MVLGAWPQQFAALDSRSDFDSRVQETTFDLSIDSIVRVCQHHLREGVRVSCTDELRPAGGCPLKPTQDCCISPLQHVHRQNPILCSGSTVQQR